MEPLNNREFAVLLWLGAGVLLCLSNREIRASLGALVRTMLHPTILVSLLATAGYVVCMIALGSQIGLWGGGLVNEAVVWFLTTALVLLFSSNRAFEKARYFRSSLRRLVAVTVLVEGFVNLYVFGLVIELLLFPLLLVLVVMATYSERTEEYASVATLMNGALGVIGFALLGYVGVRLAIDWDQRDATHDVRLLVLPIWLSLGILPFIYLVGLIGAYGRTFLRLKWASSGRRARLRAKVALILGIGLRARYVGDFSGAWIQRLADAPSFSGARAVVRRFAAGKREEDRYMTGESA